MTGSKQPLTDVLERHVFQPVLRAKPEGVPPAADRLGVRGDGD
ncbi:hypothetical protein [Plastoroseomonas hellenica]|nr:hypothetical protein [Plastoroseomonas hellenica]